MAEGGWRVAESLDEELMARIRSSLPKIKQPAWNDRVRKTECVLSFDTPESPHGLFVSMENFQGYGADFIDLDHTRSNNPLYLNIKWKKVPKPQDEKMEDKTEAPTKMAIGVEGGFQVDDEQFEYEKSYFLAVMPQRVLIPLPQPELPELVTMIIDGILKASDMSADEAQVMAWEEKRQPSKYADGLVQLDNGKKISPDPSTWACEESGKKENLWLNLSDGYIGSGRAQVDASGQMSGGTGSALRHYEEEKAKGNHYPLAVKLGTITPNGADVYSYAPDEDDMVEDPKLAEHLSHWGINMMQMEKTEKTMAELQIDLNMKFDFDKICESGKQLQPLCGPGYVGLKNLGNSCYMNSVVQVLCAMPEVKANYFDRAQQIFEKSPAGRSAEDFSTQMAKLSVGLLSDRYCKPGSKEAEEQSAYVSPQMFKFLVGKGHAEFSTGNQQDAFEYWSWLLNKMERAERTDGAEGITWKLFEFQSETRLKCTQSNKVSYSVGTERALSLTIPLKAATNTAEVQSYEERTAKRQKNGEADAESKEEPVKPVIPFAACAENWAADSAIDGWISPVTNAAGVALKSTRFKTFPKYLVCNMRRYVLGEDWRPMKLDVLVKAPETLDLEYLRGKGQQEGEELLPDSPVPEAAAQAPASTRITPDEGLVRQLMDMGFAENGCRRAAVATSNAGAEAAMEWVLAHMGDPDFNDPLPQEGPPGTGGPGPSISPEAVEMLCSMGFQKKHAERALRQADGDVERAGDWLLSRVDMLDSMEDEPEASAPMMVEEVGGGPADYKPQYELMALISHIGNSTASGHYVCHIKKEGRWCIFNDRKVAVSEEPPLDLAYMYVYRSVGPA